MPQAKLAVQPTHRRSSVISVNLNNNASAKIQNPLAGLSPAELNLQVEEFAKEKQLDDILPLLKKGASLAQNPKQYGDMAGLYDEEHKALNDEVQHRWRQPRRLYFTVVLCSVGAAVQYVSHYSPYVTNVEVEAGIKRAPTGLICLFHRH